MFVEHRRREEDHLPARLLGFIRRFFIVIGVLTTIGLVFLTMTISRLAHYIPPSLPDSMVLTYTFKSGLMEKVTSPSLSQPLLIPAITFHDVIDDLARAAKDSRVKGFVARLQDIELAPAQIQELRNAVAAFRTSGKFASVFAEDFGGMGSGMGEYYLASSFDQIWLQPVGEVSIGGVSAEVPFLKGLLDKVGVEAEFSHRGIYKSAPESLTETAMSAPHREMMTSLIDDLAGQIETGIAADRKINIDGLRQIVNSAPYSDNDALKLKLVDRLGYYDEMLEEAKAKAGDDAQPVELSDYSFDDSHPAFNKNMSGGMAGKFFHKDVSALAAGSKSRIALIIGSGEIVSSKDDIAGISESGMSADKITEAFGEAEKDDNVAAVIFRIDSPGGSPAAAETIRHAIVKMRKKGRPVIVSMGGYAASGGYWIATGADKIVAEPATITGSIGVFGGKIVLASLWDKIGVNWEGISSGDNARMWSSNVAFTPNQKARFDSMLGSIYEAFIARVMDGRKMTHDQVAAVAEGRVWTGKQAKEKGLVDELGGIDKAVELAKAAAKLPPEQEIPLKQFPAEKSTLELFIQLATEGVSVIPSIKISAEDVLRGLKASMKDETGVLRAPALQIH
jgi:protease-4